MKKLFAILIFALAWLPMVTQAQDVITKRDGSTIQAVVVEVNQSEIKYKSFSNQEGPLYIINKNDVVLIQYKNGENEVIEPVIEKKKNVITSIPKYRLLKESISYSDYVPCQNDKYSPGWCGFASFVIPGLGQAICNEWGRAAGFVVSNIVLNTIGSTYVQKSYVDYYPQWKTDIAVAVVAYAVGVGLNIWSIVDAVRIAKIKDAWCQRAMASAFDLYVTPSLTFNPLSNNDNPIMGLSLTLNF